MAKNHIPWIYADGVADLELRNINMHQADTKAHKLALDPVFENVRDLKKISVP